LVGRAVSVWSILREAASRGPSALMLEVSLKFELVTPNANEGWVG